MHDLKAGFQRKRQVVMEIYRNWHANTAKEVMKTHYRLAAELIIIRF